MCTLTLFVVSGLRVRLHSAPYLLRAHVWSLMGMSLGMPKLVTCSPAVEIFTLKGSSETSNLRSGRAHGYQRPGLIGEELDV